MNATQHACTTGVDSRKRITSLDLDSALDLPSWAWAQRSRQRTLTPEMNVHNHNPTPRRLMPSPKMDVSGNFWNSSSEGSCERRSPQERVPQTRDRVPGQGTSQSSHSASLYQRLTMTPPPVIQPFEGGQRAKPEAKTDRKRAWLRPVFGGPKPLGWNYTS
jgi:hypothetical protein